MAARALPYPLVLGGVLADRYRLESVVGAGGMSVIVAAFDVVEERRVAVKLIRAEVGLTDRDERLRREVQALEAMRGVYVTEVFDVGEQPNGAPFFVMELLEGQSLADLVAAAGQLPVARAVDYLVMACHALDAAHRRGIVHRDLKPSNLFVVRGVDGAAPILKVLDFGIAKLLISTGGAKSDHALTATSDRLGTSRYMSPEQLTSARDVTARTDIWALGVVLFEMLTGARPFEAEHEAGVSRAILELDPPSVRDARPDVPAALDEIVRGCLAKDPAERLPSARALLAALAPFGSARSRSTAPGAAPARTSESDTSEGISTAVPRASTSDTPPVDARARAPARRALGRAPLLVGGACVVVALAWFGGWWSGRLRSSASDRPTSSAVAAHGEDDARALPSEAPAHVPTAAASALASSAPAPRSSASAAPSAAVAIRSPVGGATSSGAIAPKPPAPLPSSVKTSGTVGAMPCPDPNCSRN